MLNYSVQTSHSKFTSNLFSLKVDAMKTGLKDMKREYKKVNIDQIEVYALDIELNHLETVIFGYTDIRHAACSLFATTVHHRAYIRMCLHAQCC